jgi:hypothetical protein
MTSDAEGGLGDIEGGINPRTKLMEEVAAQMDALEEDFGDDFRILKVITVLQIERPDGVVGIRVRNSSDSALEALGMLHVAQDIVKAQAAEE